MCTGSCFTKILSVSVPVTHLMTFKWNSATDPNKLLDSIFLSLCIVSLGQRKQIYFFSAEKGIHISHRTPIIGSNPGLTTLGMPLKSWESHVQKEVISNIFLWSTLYSCCMWVSSNHTHTHPNSTHKSTIYPPASNELVGSFRDIKIHWSFETLTLEINYEHYKFEFSSKNKSRAHLKIIKSIYHSNLSYLCIHYGYPS